MSTVAVDSTSQRYTSRVAQKPDILLLHTTEGMSWPGYNGGKTAPHDTVRPIRGKGIEVRRHYPYDQFSKSLENDAGGVETNKRGVIQVELMGTCDPKHRGDPKWYFWPDADDAVLEALADYYRPIMARYGIPARAMAKFVAYPASYGNTPTRLTFAEWMNGSGICGHQHAPENAHGDPGAFPIARFIRFLAPAKPPTAPPAAPPAPVASKDTIMHTLVKLANTDAVWLSDLITRRWVQSRDELALLQATLKSRGVPSAVTVVTSLAPYGVPVGKLPA